MFSFEFLLSPKTIRVTDQVCTILLLACFRALIGEINKSVVKNGGNC